MLKKLLWHTKRTFGGISASYMKQELERRIVMIRLVFLFLVLLPCFNLCTSIMERSGARYALYWLSYRRSLTDTDRSHLFVAAFVSFLFLNLSAILLFSYFIYEEAWVFFSALQTLCFVWLLFNINYMRVWLGKEDGLRPDEQLINKNATLPRSPMQYFGRIVLFLLIGEAKKLFVGFFWFFIITFMIVMPIYFKY